MGTVYLGQAPDDRLVAVKVIRPDLAGDEGFLARFRDEIANVERVASFCTAQVLDHGMADGRAFMVTEYIEGPSLHRLVTQDGALPQGLLHGVAVGVAAALVAIHSAGLIHRDLKPRNVLLSWSGPRVIDFGIARALDATSGHTGTGEMVGSLGWLAPEQILNDEVTEAVDIFAWGCLLAFAGNGRHPFGEGRFGVMAARVVHAEPEIGTLPAPLAELVQAALHKDWRRRPTAQELLLALVGGVDGEAAVSSTWDNTWPRSVSASEPLPADGAALAELSRTPRRDTTPPRAAAAGGPTDESFWDTTDAPSAVGSAADSSFKERLVRWRPHALAASSMVFTLMIGFLALWSDSRVQSVPRAPKPLPTTTALAPPPERVPLPAPLSAFPLPAFPLPASPLLVRLDTAPGWPDRCHADIARTAPSTHDSKTHNPKTLSSDAGCDTYPQWSPDHRRIVFIRKMPGPSEVWVMNAEGSDRRLVTGRAASGTRASWAPDGSRLAYLGYDGDLYAITIGESVPRRLTFSSLRKSDPAWSPDGRHLAFWAGKEGQEQIHLLDVQNPARPWTKLTPALYGAVDPAWSPDGKKIAFTYRAAHDRGSDIWVMNANGSDQHLLTVSTDDRKTDPSWSPGGTWIAYAKGPFGDPRIWAIRADGTGDRAITSRSRREGHPAWS